MISTAFCNVYLTNQIIFNSSNSRFRIGIGVLIIRRTISTLFNLLVLECMQYSIFLLLTLLPNGNERENARIKNFQSAD